MLDTTRTTLFERDDELASLEALIAEACGGSGHVVLIEGPAGIGKTRLLAEARDRGAAAMTVLNARASDLEQAFPFGVVRQLFEAAVTDPGERGAAFGGAAGAARAVFEDAPVEGREHGVFATLHGLFWLALNVAERRPLLLAVDDLQWCDRESLRFLAYLTRRLEGERILVVATQRTSDPGTDPALLADIAHDPVTAALRPRPLTLDGVLDLVGARLGRDADAAFCAACYEATGGNPLMLRQLLTALEGDRVQPLRANARRVAEIGPRAVSRTVLRRILRLSDEARAVARATAVLGEGAELMAIAKLAGVDEQRVARATGELARAEILRHELPLGFVHPLVREAVYRDIPPGERELTHARAAVLLRAAGGSVDQVAAQLLHAPRQDAGWVTELLLEAGVAARRRGAADSAVAYLRRALAEPPPPGARLEVVRELGMAEALTDAPAAIEHLQTAYAALADPAERALVAQQLALLWCFTDTPHRALELAHDAAAGMPEELGDERRRLEAVGYMAVFFGGGDFALLEALAGFRDGIDAAGAGARMLEAVTAWSWTLACGPAERCVALALRALAGTELLDGDHTFCVASAMATLVAADRDEAVAQWETIRAATHRRGSLFSALTVNLWEGFTLLRRGDLADAEALVRQSAHETTLWGVGDYAGASTGCGILAEVLVERGDLAGAEAVLAAGPPLVRDNDGENHMRRARAALALARGATDEALAAADAYAANESGMTNPAWQPWRSLRALALARAGREDEALADAHAELELARAYGAPRALGRALRVLGTLERERGIDRLRAAVDTLAASPARLEHAYALAALGSALRRARRPNDARAPLREALDLAAQCGADPLAEHARAELHAAGARPRAEALQGVAALTPSELRIAALAAGGSTNKAIAQTLFVTPKTVELHLSNAYRKLGIRTRHELGAALART